MEVRRLTAQEAELVATIDRSEHVDREYEVVHGRLQERRVTMVAIPPWDRVGRGPHSAAAKVAFCRDLVERGAALLGAFSHDEVLGAAVVDPIFNPPLAWLAFLHVSRPHRRKGVASRLWRSAVDMARANEARRMYISATPTGSAVGFYLHQGCVLARPPDPTLYEKEPDDIHLVLHL